MNNQIIQIGHVYVFSNFEINVKIILFKNNILYLVCFIFEKLCLIDYQIKYEKNYQKMYK